MVKLPFNVVWNEKTKPDEEGVLLKVQVNVSASGIINPGSYDIEIRGNQVYWPLGESK